MKALKDSKVLVTGASGFIGSHLVKRLHDMGAFVGATEHENAVSREYCDVIYGCDLSNKNDIYFAVENFKPDYVFHLASEAIVNEATNSPRETIETNVMGSSNLFLALTEHLSVGELHRVIVASTDKVYGRHNYLPYQEDFALLGTQQIYETTKNCEDILAQSFAHTYGLPVVIARFGNVYGPGDNHDSRLIPGIILAYLKGEVPQIRSNGQFYRDYIYIDDVIDGYIKLAEANLTKNPEIYNFGRGYGARVLDVVALIYEHFPNGKMPKINYGAKNEIEKQYVDGTKAKNDLEWYPKVKLRDGIGITVEWYRENHA